MTAAFVRHSSDVSPVPCPCGFSTRIVTARDGAPCSLHITDITTAKRHYHRRTTEVYTILEGTGKIELDDRWFDIRPGSTVFIPAGTRHRIVADTNIRTVVVAVPPFDAEDEFADPASESR
jgi:mannose-6-phosphate isomerase-like protein (cupin superfamily)